MESRALAVPSPEPTAGIAALRQMVLNAVVSPHTRRNYTKALDEVFTFSEQRQQPLFRALLMEYRAFMLERNLSPSANNVRLSAVRKLIGEAKRNGILGSEQVPQMAAIPNIRQQGTRQGNWLTRDQARALWVKQLIDAWTAAAGHNAGCLLRPVNKSGRVAGGGIDRLAV